MSLKEGETRRHSVERIVSGDLGGPPLEPEQWKKFLSPEIPNPQSIEEINNLPSAEFYSYINNLARETIQSPDYHDPDTGLISKEAWKRLVDSGMLAASFGDRDRSSRLEDIMHTTRILSFYDINLGLSFGITTALAIHPIERFGSPEQKEKYLTAIREGKRFGLGVTEKNGSGSSALEMDSSYVINIPDEKEKERSIKPTVHLKFAKHVQGLSGQDGLVIAATGSDLLGLFVVDQADINTQITEMAGLHGIPYGINEGNVTLDLKDNLMQELPRKRILKEFVDMFTKSRIMFPSMVLGHLERTEAEAEIFATQRKIGEKYQDKMEVPRYILDKARTRRIIDEAIFERMGKYRTPDGESLFEADTTKFTLEANIAKVITTEYSLTTAADRAELMGAAAFYKDSALQDFNNIWPFQIFEGSRRMLNTSIGHEFSRRLKNSNNKGVFFGSVNSGQNMDEGVFDKVKAMGVKTKSNIQEEILGQVALRCFALECLDPEKIDPVEFERAKIMLNLEINQIDLEFGSLESRETVLQENVPQSI